MSFRQTIKNCKEFGATAEAAAAGAAYGMQSVPAGYFDFNPRSVYDIINRAENPELVNEEAVRLGRMKVSGTPYLVRLNARLPPSAEDKVPIGKDGIYVTTSPTNDGNAVVLGSDKYGKFLPGAAENMFVGSFREAREGRISLNELRQAIEGLEGDSPLKKIL